jgi:DNA-binding CsgD family transcriptional regulator
VTQRSKHASGRLALVPIPPPSQPPPPPQEIVLDGRKYRLVPLEAEAPDARAVPAPVPTPMPTPTPAPVAPSARPAPPEVLTARELQIVALVAEGLANKQIAAELGISEWTVSTHLRRIYAKLDVDTRAAMVNRCYGALTARASLPPIE